MQATDPAAANLDAKQLAARWRTSEQSLAQRRYQHDGPPYLKIGRRVLYSLRDVEAYEAANRTDPQEVAKNLTWQPVNA